MTSNQYEGDSRETRRETLQKRNRRIGNMVFVLTGLLCQLIGMILIMLSAVLAGLLTLPVWISMIVSDLEWSQWYHSTREKLSRL